MIAADYLKRIAAWSRELTEQEIEIARAGISEKSYRANEFIFMRGDNFQYWTGIVTGLARMARAAKRSSVPFHASPTISPGGSKRPRPSARARRRRTERRLPHASRCRLRLKMLSIPCS